MSRGKLIVIEGLDGSGKATQTNLLCETLARQKKAFRKLSFPDYNEPSSALVKMYLNSEFGASPEEVNVYAASSFYAVDRYASFKKFWRTDYENGKIIVADRYTTSNAIYQLCRLDKRLWSDYLAWLEDYEYCKLELPRPDLVIYLDMPIEVSQRLMSQRYHGDDSQKDLHEKNVDFLRKCRDAAIHTAEKLKWQVIPCSEGGLPKKVEEISAAIEDVLSRHAW